MAGPPIQGQSHDGPSEPAKWRDGNSRDEQDARRGEPENGAPWREERRGQLPGERYMRIVRPHGVIARAPEAAEGSAPSALARRHTSLSRLWRRVRNAIREAPLTGYLLRPRGSAGTSTGGAAIATPGTALPGAAAGPSRPRERVVRRTIVRPEKVVLQREIRYRRPMRAPLLLALGFAVTILLGSLLLSMPIANREGVVTPHIVALFTATSAVCVTGLVVVDTLSYWTPFGQAVIALLIQVGGLGFMTASTFLLTLLGRRINLAERLLLKEAHGVTPLVLCRGKELIVNPSKNEPISGGDTLVVTGRDRDLEAVGAM